MRETLHVHSARHGSASNLKLGAPIEIVMNNKSAKFGEDLSQNEPTVIVQSLHILIYGKLYTCITRDRNAQ